MRTTIYSKTRRFLSVFLMIMMMVGMMSANLALSDGEVEAVVTAEPAQAPAPAAEPVKSAEPDPTNAPTEKPQAAEPTSVPTEKPQEAEPTTAPTEKPQEVESSVEPTEKPQASEPTAVPAEKPLKAEATVAPTEVPTAEPKPETGNSLSGIVWLDENGDGRMQDDEKRLRDMRVLLYAKEDRKTSIIAETYTDKDGVYEFVNLEPGAYYLTVEETKEAYLPEIGVKRDNSVRPQDITDKETTRRTGFSEEIRVGAYSVIEDINVGMLPKELKQAALSALTGSEDDPIVNASDGGTNGGDAPPVIAPDPDGGDEDGNDGDSGIVTPGDGELSDGEQDDGNEDVDGGDSDGGDFGDGEPGGGEPDDSESEDEEPEDGEPVDGEPSDGEEGDDIENAPYANSIRGIAWLDVDGDGVMGEDEVRLSGFEVALVPSDIEAESLSTVTGEDGSFAFDDILLGEWRVLALATSELSSPATIGADNFIDENGYSEALTLDADSVIENICIGMLPAAFGEAETTYENSISGILWLDMYQNIIDGDYENSIYDGDGIRQEEELPLAGYPVGLYLESDRLTAIQKVATDENGKYVFENIPPDSYVIGVKTSILNEVEYLLPLWVLDGTQGDNRFVATYDEEADAYLFAYTKPLEIEEDTIVTDLDGGMRTLPEIQPMTGPYVQEIDVGAATTAITISTSGTYRLYGTTTNNNRYITVSTGVTATFDLDGVSMTCSTSPFRLNGTANVTLDLMEGKSNMLTCTGTSTTNTIVQAGLYAPETTTLTIKGMGSLTVLGGYYSAGIGGSPTSSIPAGSCGTIMISGGTVTATAAAYGGAGIGRGYIGVGAVGPNITISGGTVNATGGNAGTGIGGAASSGAGNIIISGGRVTATSTNSSNPGIGSNTYTTGSTLGTVVFTGGSIYPTTSYSYLVYPAPTNGSANGNDLVGMVTFPGYSGGDAFSIMAGGSLRAYPYSAIAHSDGNVYAWLASPAVITDAATGVTDDSATLNGTYYFNGTTISSSYFEWGTSTSYSNTETLTAPFGAAGTHSSVSSALTGILDPNTAYHCRLVITVGGVPIPGNDVTFYTKPVVDTLIAAPTGSATATVSGTIASGSENISDVIITYATDAGFTANVVTIDGLSGVTFTNTTYSANLAGLTSGQTYYVKVEAVGPGGSSDTKTGSFLAGGYPVTEKFVGFNGSPIDSISLPDNTIFVSGSYTASGIPTSHTVGGDTYTYLGYKLDSYAAGDSLTSGTPSSVAITGNRDVYYVYEIFINLTVTKTIIGAYADMTKSFTFTVTLLESDGVTPLTGTFNYTGGIIAGSGATAPSGGILTLNASGSDTITLGHGQTITISGVPASGKARVAETVDPFYSTTIEDSEGGITTGTDTGALTLSGDRTFAFTNANVDVVPTGIGMGNLGGMYLLLFALALMMGGLVLGSVRRGRRER